MEVAVLVDAIEAVRTAMCSVDFDVMSGADAAALVSLCTPLKNQFDAFVLAASTHAVWANQHNADGARSGAAWMAQKTGVSEKQARAALALKRQLEELPQVAKAVRSGELSLAKASAIGRACEGDESVAESLLQVAQSGTVEMVEVHAREIRHSRSDASRQQRLRRSQFVNVHVDQDSMVCGEFRLLPQYATSLLEAYRNADGSTSFERAESFAKALGISGPIRTEVVFHLDVSIDESKEPRLGDRAWLRGVGPVPVESVTEVFEDASFKLVGTSNNKLTWFSEKNRRSSDAPLPEYVKRAVRAKAYDCCEVSGCVGLAEQVDHVQARCNNGVNDPSNLQALCEADHHAKTKLDAPWTVGGIYGRYTRPPPGERGDELVRTG